MSRGANERRQLASYSDSTQSKLDLCELDSSSSSTRNVNESSRVEQLVTQLEKFARNSNIFVYKILKVLLKILYLYFRG